MRKTLTICAAIVLISTAASATTITAYPGDYFWEGTAIPGVPGDAAPGWDTGSWQAPGAYAKIGFAPTTLFGRTVTVGELASVSYWTKKDTLHTVDAADWFFQMYTTPYAGSPGSSWYGNRINSEPYFSDDLTETAGTWTKWQTDDGQPNRLRFFDSSSGYFGSYTDGFLSDLTSDANYANQEIMIIALGLGTAWANGFDGLLDGLTIELTDGSVANVNFEAAQAPIPEPATMTMLGLGLGGLALRRIRRKRD